MRPVLALFVAAALALAGVRPAAAQMTPAGPTGARGAASQSGDGPSLRSGVTTAPSASRPQLPSWPQDGIGLCQCGYTGGTAKASDQAFGRTTLGLRCMAAVEECRSACSGTSGFRFVPHAGFSCPNRPGEAVGSVALNGAPRTLRLAGR